MSAAFISAVVPLSGPWDIAESPGGVYARNLGNGAGFSFAIADDALAVEEMAREARLLLERRKARADRETTEAIEGLRRKLSGEAVSAK